MEWSEMERNLQIHMIRIEIKRFQFLVLLHGPVVIVVHYDDLFKSYAAEEDPQCEIEN